MNAVPHAPVKRFRQLAFLLSLSFFLFSCASVPVTERRGLHLVPDSELTTMSYQEYNNVLKSRSSRRTWKR